jgi:hypothetical protein
MGFVVGKVGAGMWSSAGTSVVHIAVVLLLLHTHSFILHPYYEVLAID